MATTNSCSSDCAPTFPDNITVTNTTNTVQVAASEGQWRRERLDVQNGRATLDFSPMVSSITIDKNGQILPYPECWALNGLQIMFATGVADENDVVSITYLTIDTVPTTIAEVGTIATFSTDTPPTGWTECDGLLESQITRAALFDVIGHTYKLEGDVEGDLDTREEFRLPNLDTSFYDGTTLVTLDSMIKF